ncbi:MAG: haloacid dehalogenase-like hydrolase [Candidatus Aenigmatarchaeota archaeon]
MRKTKAAIFDVDMTLTKRVVGYELYKYLNETGVFPDENMESIDNVIDNYGKGRISYDILCKTYDSAVTSGLCGKSVRDVERAAARVFHTHDFYFSYARELVNLFSGEKKVLISTGPKEIISLVAADLGTDDFFASEIRRMNGTYLGDLGVCMSPKDAKKKLVIHYAEKNGIDLSESFGFGDSGHDSHLEIVGYPVVLNPRPEFIGTARDRGWTILTEHDDVIGKVKEMKGALNGRHN